MLKDWNKVEQPTAEEVDKRLANAKNSLLQQQIAMKEKKLPVIVLLEGWGAAGKGSVLGKLIKNIDPRFFKVAVMDEPTEEEKRKPFLYRYLLLKFFFNIDKKEQKKRLKKLVEDKNTAWRVSKHDRWQNKHYDECMEVYDQFLCDTNHSTAPWYIVDAKDKKWAQLQILETIVQGIDTAFANSALSVPLLQNAFPLKPISRLDEVSLDKSLTDEEYERLLDLYQKRLKELHNELYRKKIPVIIAYEGWDAAGKGGNIKRITEALDPRGYEVHPIASPEPHEKSRHYLWRFWNRLPKTGHVAIFDRTWYGRVMVERLEGFCSKNDWQRAYVEINEFEKELSDWGAIIVKFWVQIDKDTQLARFKERENTPEKRWKITDEDWRNREKWDSYEEAVNEMLEKTNTSYAPWHILESNDKKYARIKALKTVIEAIEKYEAK